jgi:hypothetical protein
MIGPLSIHFSQHQPDCGVVLPLHFPGGHTTSIVLEIVATSLVYSGKLDAATVSGLSTLPVIACTRTLDRGGKQLRDATDRLCQLLETLDRPKPLPSKGDF